MKNELILNSEQVCSYLYNFLNVRMQLNHSWWLGKKVVKLDQIYFWFFFLFVTAIRLIYCKLDIYLILNTYVRVFVQFIKKSNCKETCSHEIQVCLFVCLFCVFGPTREFSPQMEMSPLPREDRKIFTYTWYSWLSRSEGFFSPTFSFKMFKEFSTSQSICIGLESVFKH